MLMRHVALVCYILRHACVALSAHALAALVAGMVMSALVLAMPPMTDDQFVGVFDVVRQWLAMVVVTAIVIWGLTLPSLLTYPLALFVSRRMGTSATIVTGGAVGAAVAFGLWLNAPGPGDYPGLTSAMYREHHLRHLLMTLPPAVCAGITFGGLSTWFNRKR